MWPTLAASSIGMTRETVHHRFERLERLDLCDDDVGAHAARTHRNALAAPAVAADDKVFACQQHIGSADDAVDGALAGAVAIVEEVLGLRVVDRDHGEGQLARRGHRTQADDAGCGLLGAADDVFQQVAALRVQHRNQIHAIVHGDVRLDIEHAIEMAVVLLGRLALDSVDRHLVIRYQRGCDVVLRAQRVGGGQRHLGATRQQDAHQVGGLGSDVHGAGHADALEGLLSLEAFFDQIEHRHLLGGPLHAEAPALGQVDVGDVILSCFGCNCHSVSPYKVLYFRRCHTLDVRAVDNETETFIDTACVRIAVIDVEHDGRDAIRL
jgi:hypothetical protein